jgi:hypothetical protein
VNAPADARRGAARRASRYTPPLLPAFLNEPRRRARRGQAVSGGRAIGAEVSCEDAFPGADGIGNGDWRVCR